MDALPEQLENLISPDKYEITSLSNMSALIFNTMPEVSWAGFYLVKEGKLILGPFQVKIACTEINFGKGVCGTTAVKKETIIVKNVHEFPGHIACDSESNSEIVVPIIVKDEVKAVIDIDAPIYNRFSKDDQEYLGQVAKILEVLF